MSKKVTKLLNKKISRKDFIKYSGTALLSFTAIPAGIKAVNELTNTKAYADTLSSTFTDDQFRIQNSSDTTKQAAFDASAISTGTTRTYTFPDADASLVGTAAVQTLTNKNIDGSANTITNVSLTSGVTNTLPINSGGTGQTTVSAAFDALSPTSTRGDLIYKGPSSNLRLPAGTSGQFLKQAASDPAWASVTHNDITDWDSSVYQLTAGPGVALTNDTVAFTTRVTALSLNTVEVTNPGTSTWTKPANALYVDVYLVGGGGGGASGRRGISGTDRSGGGGGGGGAVTSLRLPAAMLGATETVVVGSGGAGGIAQTTNSTNGNSGAKGTNTTFGTSKIVAGGGNQGIGGNTTAGSGGVNMHAGTDAGFNGGGGSNLVGGNGGLVLGHQVISAGQAGMGASGGGGGGGLTAANVPANGGVGSSGPAWMAGQTGGVIGTTTGARNGGNAKVILYAGGGGGGGAAGNATGTINGGNGGNGVRGGGGGGGGASTNGVSSGVGGNGGDGYALIITYVGSGA